MKLDILGVQCSTYGSYFLLWKWITNKINDEIDIAILIIFHSSLNFAKLKQQTMQYDSGLHASNNIRSLNTHDVSTQGTFHIFRK